MIEHIMIYAFHMIHMHIISNDPMSGAGSNHLIHVFDKGGVTD